MAPPRPLTQNQQIMANAFLDMRIHQRDLGRRIIAADTAGRGPLPQRATHTHAPRFVAQSPTTALHHATSGHRPQHGRPAATTGRAPQAQRPGPAFHLTSQRAVGQTTGLRRDEFIEYRFEHRPSTPRPRVNIWNHPRTQRPLTRDERVRDLIGQAQARISGARVDLNLGTPSSLARARAEFSAANQLLQQAGRLSHGHRMNPETRSALRETNARLDSALLDLPESRLT
jgi:hypothetical protein